MPERAAVAQGNGFWEREMISSVDIDMLEAQGGQSFDILWSDLLPIAPQFVECILHVPGIPEHDDIDDQAQRTQLIFLPLTIPLTQLAALAVKHMASDTVPPSPRFK
ncbi:hypothetical protein KSB_48510 [Ktedonobacter robiniae]|uniref:Uncharacterized protein n=1 Tax=Ktedonobacter robiniae TaxID=2778365 RepID=A0ABQ3UU82_9CHLR|nr:hypothetical protein KSB_48510 [Ktedonobacter robiniae]